MSRCPHGDHNLILPDNTEINLETYHTPAVSITLCCNKGVNVRPVTIFRATAYTGKETHDDWGRKMAK